MLGFSRCQDHAELLLPLITTTLMKKEVMNGIFRFCKAPMREKLWSNHRSHLFVRLTPKSETFIELLDILAKSIGID